MTQLQLHTRLSSLFRETSSQHQAAFSENEGRDPEWPLWYADYLQMPLSEAFDIHFYKSQLIYCLMKANFEHTARAPEVDWADFWANEFIEHYAPSDTAESDRLALYFMPTCPFCQRVMKVIAKLGIDVEMRNIIRNPERRDELIGARDRATVPVLWIKSPDGDVRWMPESLDIIRYLEKTYGPESQN